MTDFFPRSSRKSTASKLLNGRFSELFRIICYIALGVYLLVGTLSLTRQAKKKATDVGLRLPLARASRKVKPQASYISKVASDEEAESSMASAAEPNLTKTKRHADVSGLDEDE